MAVICLTCQVLRWLAGRASSRPMSDRLMSECVSYLVLFVTDNAVWGMLPCAPPSLHACGFATHFMPHCSHSVHQTGPPFLVKALRFRPGKTRVVQQQVM